MILILACIFGVILYTLLGYPIFLFFIAKFKKVNNNADPYQEIDWPKVTLIIAAYNEEKSIRDKLENSLKLDYQKDKLEIVVVSDHSSDGTDNIVKSYANKGIRLHRMPKRGGKLAGHKSVLKEIKTDIVIFSDATTIYQKDAIKELVRHFIVKEIGCVGGAITYKEFAHEDSGVKEQRYFSYEVMIRKLENQVDSVPVVSGAIYAIRKELYADIPDHLADDLINPLYVRKLGYRTLFEPNARCWETTPRNLRGEYLKRKRIAAQNVAGLFYMKGLLNPFKYLVFSWIIFSHKVLRLILPFLYVVIFVTGLLLIGNWLNLRSIVFMIGLTILGYLILRYLGIFKKVIRLFSLPLYFVIFHFGIIQGIVESFFGKKYATWQSD